jgi:hypothetical protein
MARARKRVCLEDGLKLDLNELIRRETVVSGRATSRISVWHTLRSSRPVAWAVLSADLTNPACARLRIRMPSLDQTVNLIGQERNFGGLQWYFLCPVLGFVASVLWDVAASALEIERNAPSADPNESQAIGW